MSDTGVKFADGDAVSNAIEAVRSDTDPTNWALAAHEGKSTDTIELVATGEGTRGPPRGRVFCEQQQKMIQSFRFLFFISGASYFRGLTFGLRQSRNRLPGTGLGGGVRFGYFCTA